MYSLLSIQLHEWELELESSYRISAVPQMCTHTELATHNRTAQQHATCPAHTHELHCISDSYLVRWNSGSHPHVPKKTDGVRAGREGQTGKQISLFSLNSLFSFLPLLTRFWSFSVAKELFHFQALIWSLVSWAGKSKILV